MSLIAIKALAIAVILLVAFGGGLAALRTRDARNAERLYSLGSFFGGGVFLGAGLIHMLPDAVAQFSDLYPDLDYPVAYTLAALGLIAILAIDRTGHAMRRHRAADGGANTSSLILLIVLSFHSILAGAAIGAEDSTANSIVLLLAILAHKGSAAFALTTRMVQESERSVWPQLALFAVMTPLGIVFGAGLQEVLEGSGARLAEGIFDALAAATFVYVATLEVIGREFEGAARSGGKFPALVAGLVVMAVVAIWL